MKQIFIEEKESPFGKCILNELGETKNDSTFIDIVDSKEKIILKKSNNEKNSIVFEHFPACKKFVNNTKALVEKVYLTLPLLIQTFSSLQDV
jgi:hypothetical protein